MPKIKDCPHCHQVLFCKSMAEKKKVIAVYETDELGPAIKNYRQLAVFRPSSKHVNVSANVRYKQRGPGMRRVRPRGARFVHLMDRHAPAGSNLRKPTGDGGGATFPARLSGER